MRAELRRQYVAACDIQGLVSAHRRMCAELRELKRLIIHCELHKDTTALMAAVSFVVGISAWAAPLALVAGAK